MTHAGYTSGELTEAAVVTEDGVIKDSPIKMDFGQQFNRSWFVRFDEDRNRSYFTYYSEFNRSSPSLVYVEIFFLCVLTIVSTVGNLLITYVVLSNKKMRTNTYLFIANMCVADILFTLTNPVIGVVRYQESWELGENSCGFLIFNQVVCGVVSIWSMTLISMDRHRCIVKTFYKCLTGMAAKITIAVCWILGLGLAIPVIIYFNVEEFEYGTRTIKICTLMWPQGAAVRVSAIFVTLSCTFGFLIPLIIILYNYIGIFRKLWSTRQNMIRQLSAQPNKKHIHQNGKNRAQMLTRTRNRRDFRVVKMLLSTVVIFGLMWLPMCIVFILILRDGITEQMRTGSWGFLLAACIAFANACINPIIYGLFNEKFRFGIKKALRRLPMMKYKRKESTTNKTAIRSISAMAEMDRTPTPSSSSAQWRESSTGSSTSEAVKAVETSVDY